MSLTRRHFLSATAAAGAVGLSALTAAGAAQQPNNRVNVAVMGVRGRGRALASGFAVLDDVHIAYLCDPDDNVMGPALKAVAARQKQAPQTVRDFRRAL